MADDAPLCAKYISLLGKLAKRERPHELQSPLFALIRLTESLVDLVEVEVHSDQPFERDATREVRETSYGFTNELQHQLFVEALSTAVAYGFDNPTDRDTLVQVRGVLLDALRLRGANPTAHYQDVVCRLQKRCDFWCTKLVALQAAIIGGGQAAGNAPPRRSSKSPVGRTSQNSKEVVDLVEDEYEARKDCSGFCYEDLLSDLKQRHQDNRELRSLTESDIKRIVNTYQRRLNRPPRKVSRRTK